MTKCLLICVGSELLRGKINTHASYLAQRLASIGLELSSEETVSDEQLEITEAIRRGLAAFQIVIVTGGLGPTFDDLSREAAAAATVRPLKVSPALLRGLQAKFRRARYRMPTANARQADLLEGARSLANPIGTAPGQWLELGAKVLILLPGPPRELHPMVEQTVLPQLKKRFPAPPQAEAHLHFVGVPESIVDDRVRPLIVREQSRAGATVQFTILAHLGLVDFDIFVSAPAQAKARSVLERIVRGVRKRMGSAFYGMNQDYPLEKVVGDRLRRIRATLAIAESCTGGLLSARLTDIPGSSEFLVESVVTYSNNAKKRDLFLPKGLLEAFGAVSNKTAMYMAEGVRERAGTTLGLAITGIAGPGGATAKKPVGLVYIALSTPKKTISHGYRFIGDRTAVRERAVLAALDLLRQVP